MKLTNKIHNLLEDSDINTDHEKHINMLKNKSDDIGGIISLKTGEVANFSSLEKNLSAPMVNVIKSNGKKARWRSWAIAIIDKHGKIISVHSESNLPLAKKKNAEWEKKRKEVKMKGILDKGDIIGWEVAGVTHIGKVLSDRPTEDPRGDGWPSYYEVDDGRTIRRFIPSQQEVKFIEQVIYETN